MRRHVNDHKPDCPDLSDECKKIADCINKAIQCGYVTQIHAPVKACKMISGMYIPEVTPGASVTSIVNDTIVPKKLIYHKNKVDRVVSFSTSVDFNMTINSISASLYLTVEDSMTNLECTTVAQIFPSGLFLPNQVSNSYSVLGFGNVITISVALRSPIVAIPPIPPLLGPTQSDLLSIAITGHYTY